MMLRWTVRSLALREPFRISRSVMSERDAVTVEIEHDGVVGRGEVVTSVYYGLTVERIEAELATAREVLAGANDPLRIHSLSAVPGVSAALDAALHDLVATLRGVPVFALLGAAHWRPTPTAYTIGIMPTERAVQTARALTGRGFTVLKVKLGAGPEPQELLRLQAIREAAPHARLLLDPNGAWEPAQAVRMLKAVEEFEIDAVEQPIKPGTPDLLAEVAAQSPVPVIADEDAATVDDVRALGSRVHGVNVKLPKCGGIRAAREIIDIARGNGVDVMLGCLVSSSLGIAPAVHLTGCARWVDLDGHLLLAHDPWAGIGGADGVLRIAGDRGLGVHPVAPL
ncbi:dipeptide epimerase [Saccharopolyspora phatthalungensis]|uniref:Dipeptide epimerase n=1 Tax=Saccharopolyspora phatthalungensis TaxID=664693 RepID=A0A840Q651_9PSEU|nr:dipeptide epimerase [Saccharopolyspora phatthalungensis]MBB5157992.1 L-alanine-DL-glutamate epimerase-like enolase superfamily enzyme [Saccharopolyspora phatthalungensis]